MIVFGFELYDAQVNANLHLMLQERDLLLLAKTGFGKSLIFQLMPFLIATPCVVLTLIPLKLLHVEQSEMIDCIPHGKDIVLNGENNATKRVLANIATGGYIY